MGEVRNQPLEITCLNCKEKFMAEEIAKPTMINEHRVSMVVWVHHRLIQCPKCLATYQPILAGIGVQSSWGVIPCKEDVGERPRVIIPPPIAFPSH